MYSQINTENFKHLNLEGLDLRRHQWEIMVTLLKNNPLPGITLEPTMIQGIGEAIFYKEELEEFKFWYFRRLKSRITEKDTLGIVGFTQVNLEDKSAIITEGISDFLLTKLMNPELNVIGLNRAGGNALARYIIESAFDDFLLVGDNDLGQSRNTGVEAISKLKQHLENRHKKCNLYIPEQGYNDIAQQILQNLKFYVNEVI